MTLRVCLDCTTAYAPDLRWCPHCRSERGVEQGSDPFRGGDMPKISRHGGPTTVGEPAKVEGSEPPSHGSSSETSSGKPSTSPEMSESAPRKRARTTGSRSRKARAVSSTAGSADSRTEADEAS